MTELQKWTLLLHVASTMAMVGLIWFVQIVHYPLFSRVGRNNFRRYEMDHQRLVAWIVAPGMFAELATAIILVWSRPVGLEPITLWIGMALLISIWLVTYSVQVPQHATLVLSYDEQVQQSLVRGNWFRTAAWSARGLLVIWMVGQVITAAADNPVTGTLSASVLQ
ncbi:MAG: hypothetical protein AAGB04_03850 [Pseudomonadota bacterium]